MAFNFLKKSGTPSDGFHRDLRKARKFFEYAHSVTDADYAIECFVNGLKHDPDNMKQHEELRQVSLKRKVEGGKPAGIAEKFKLAGKDPIERMLNAEKLLAKDPMNVALMLQFMERIVEADEAEPDLHLGELAHWIGNMILNSMQSTRNYKKGSITLLRDLFARAQVFDKAVEACKMLLALEPGNSNVLQDLKNLEAERTMQQGGYADNVKKDGGFRDNVKDADKQQALEQEDTLTKTESVVEQIIARRRAELEEAPEDQDRIVKLIDALLPREDDDSDEEAIELLQALWEKSGQYRFKMRQGDIRMKQLGRQIRITKQAFDGQSDDTELKKQYQDLLRKQLQMQLEEYTERVANYPTELKYRYNLGRCLFAVGKYDEAISSFQLAKADPKVRSSSYEFLGRCYLQQNWFDEAVDTLRQGIETHGDPNDNQALELRYLLMDALEKAAAKNNNLEQGREAMKLASHILQSNINFRDIKVRMDKLRKLVDQIQKNGPDKAA